MLLIIILTAFLSSFIFCFGNYRKSKISYDMSRVKPCIESKPIPKSHVFNWYFNWVILITIVVLLLCSCSGMRTGFYTIKEIRGLNTIVFKELPNEDYHVPRSDTLKVGQKIHLKRVYKEKDADVW